MPLYKGVQIGIDLCPPSIDQVTTAETDTSKRLAPDGTGGVEWVAGGGGGSVTGPVSSTDNAIARWDGADGDTLQDSKVIIDDSDRVSGVTILTGPAVTVTDPAGAAPAIDWTTNQRQGLVLSANATLGAFVDPAGPCTGLRLSIEQHASSGPYTFDWNGRVKWAAGVEPVVTFVDGAECVFYFDFDGTDYIGTGALDVS